MPRGIVKVVLIGFFATLFGCGKNDERFVTEKAFQKNLANQAAMSQQTLKQLRQYDVTEFTTLKIEFFFYTDTADKAADLVAVLKQKYHEVEHGPSAGGDKTFVITGWTTPMTMNEVTIVEWTREMCRIGFEHDCDFDGWGTNPKQNEDTDSGDLSHMIKLYKRTGKQTLYWEAWDAGNRSVTVHWGTLGETGHTRDVLIPENISADAVIDRESQEPRSEGYQEIDIEDHVQIIVQFKTEDTWGDVADLDKRHKVENILNECLGWTGNGHCDGGDIGSGTINAFSFVVDPYLAKDAIVAALKKERLIDGAIIAIDNEDDYEVLWPEDFHGEFSIF